MDEVEKNAKKPVKQLNYFVKKLNIFFYFHEDTRVLLFMAWKLLGLALGIPETAESVHTELIWQRKGGGGEDNIMAQGLMEFGLWATVWGAGFEQESRSLSMKGMEGENKDAHIANNRIYWELIKQFDWLIWILTVWWNGPWGTECNIKNELVRITQKYFKISGTRMNEGMKKKKIIETVQN